MRKMSTLSILYTFIEKLNTKCIENGLTFRILRMNETCSDDYFIFINKILYPISYRGYNGEKIVDFFDICNLESSVEKFITDIEFDNNILQNIKSKKCNCKCELKFRDISVSECSVFDVLTREYLDEGKEDNNDKISHIVSLKSIKNDNHIC